MTAENISESTMSNGRANHPSWLKFLFVIMGIGAVWVAIAGAIYKFEEKSIPLEYVLILSGSVLSIALSFGFSYAQWIKQRSCASALISKQQPVLLGILGVINDFDVHSKRIKEKRKSYDKYLKDSDSQDCLKYAYLELLMDVELYLDDFRGNLSSEVKTIASEYSIEREILQDDIQASLESLCKKPDNKDDKQRSRSSDIENHLEEGGTARDN